MTICYSRGLGVQTSVEVSVLCVFEFTSICGIVVDMAILPAVGPWAAHLRSGNFGA